MLGSSILILNLVIEPGTGVGPPTLGGGFGDAKNFGGLINLKTHEVAELDEFGLLRFERGEAIQRFIEREQLVVGRGTGDFDFIRVQVLGAASRDVAGFCGGRGQ